MNRTRHRTSTLHFNISTIYLGIDIPSSPALQRSCHPIKHPQASLDVAGKCIAIRAGRYFSTNAARPPCGIEYCALFLQVQVRLRPGQDGLKGGLGRPTAVQKLKLPLGRWSKLDDNN